MDKLDLAKAYKSYYSALTKPQLAASHSDAGLCY